MIFPIRACQLDILQRLSTESAIYQALRNLPKTLDGTYERILLNIPEFNRCYAKRALQWLSFHPSRLRRGRLWLTLAPLAVAVTLPCHHGALRLEDLLLDVSDLQDICTCLTVLPEVNYKNGGWKFTPPAMLSHYTVKEFLVSDGPQHSIAAQFRISESSSNILIPEMVHGGQGLSSFPRASTPLKKAPPIFCHA